MKMIKNGLSICNKIRLEWIDLIVTMLSIKWIVQKTRIILKLKNSRCRSEWCLPEGGLLQRGSTLLWTEEVGIILIRRPVIIKRLSFHLATKDRNRLQKAAKCLSIPMLSLQLIAVLMLIMIRARNVVVVKQKIYFQLARI